MRDEYSKFWIKAREKKYGFLEYDKALCEIMTSVFPKEGKILEVGIGTGFPFGQFLIKAGYSIYGVDISPRLIEKCYLNFPEIISVVGDAENLEFRENNFDAVYCFHSTFFFPNFPKALQEMVRVTRKNGYILFDIQNSRNSEISALFQKQIKINQGIGKLKQILKNIKGMILNDVINWDFIIYETPTDPKLILNYFNNPKQIRIFAPDPYPSGDFIKLKPSGHYRKYPRLVFLIQKL